MVSGKPMGSKGGCHENVLGNEVNAKVRRVFVAGNPPPEAGAAGGPRLPFFGRLRMGWHG